MPTSNGIITAPVSIEDVRITLGVSSTDLGILCTSSKINKWARYKPIALKHVNTPDHPRPITEEEKRRNNQGLELKKLLDVTTSGSISKYTLTQNPSWPYSPPTTGYFKRITDFTNTTAPTEQGYNSRADPPIYLLMETRLTNDPLSPWNITKDADGQYTVTFNLFFDPDLEKFAFISSYKISDEGLEYGSNIELSLDNFTGFLLGGATTFADYYFGLIAVEQDNNGLWHPLYSNNNTENLALMVAKERLSARGNGGSSVGAIAFTDGDGATLKRVYWMPFYELLTGVRSVLYVVPCIVPITSWNKTYTSHNGYNVAYGLGDNALAGCISFPDSYIIKVTTKYLNPYNEQITTLIVENSLYIITYINENPISSYRPYLSANSIPSPPKTSNGMIDYSKTDWYIPRRGVHRASMAVCIMCNKIINNNSVEYTKSDLTSIFHNYYWGNSYIKVPVTTFTISSLIPYGGISVDESLQSSWDNSGKITFTSAGQSVYVNVSILLEDYSTSFTDVFGEHDKFDANGNPMSPMGVPGQETSAVRNFTFKLSSSLLDIYTGYFI